MEAAKANAFSIKQLQAIQQTQTSNQYLGYALAEIALTTGNHELAMQQLRILTHSACD